jgi:hypothetical protein
VQAAARDDDSAAVEFSALTNAGLTGIAERSDGGTTQGNGGGFAVWDGVKATIGATGNTTATIANSVVNAFLTIALKPAPLVVTSATLNGAASVTVLDGSSITAVVNASVAAGSQWRSTGWRISGTAPGTLTCVNHPNHDVAGSFNEAFTVTAPSTVGTYNVYFIAYTDDACGANPSSALVMSGAVVTQSWVEFNATGGTTATNGLHFYIEDTTKVQVRRLNNTGQVYSPNAIPPSTGLDNGIFLRANGTVYGPSHSVLAGFAPPMYDTYSITPASPPNPSSSGVQQTATGTFGINAGPQVSVLWKYTTPLDFITAEVTVTIPAGYTVSAANPVRYYHVYDTYLGGSDNGCGLSFVDASTGKRLIGTYPPVLAGNACSPTTSIPSGASIVESFRERSGLSFSSYCVAGWNTFYANGSPACSVLQAAPMNNTVVSTYQDTGIGIEFDFTAPGTYTFSYDFVIGSPNVPPYDHLEIQHDGTGTLCPENISVLACTSSDVPCPAGSIVNTGTLTGSITTTPAAPAVTKSDTISVGASPNIQTIALTTAAAGTVTLGSTGLTSGGVASVPLNGTKCWNTATSTESCAITFTATPCVNAYECMETGVAYNNRTATPTARNPLYTKLSGTNFKFDIIALQSSGAQATSYTASGNVTVELFDDTSPPASCSAYSSPVASQAITLGSGDNGRKTLTTNINLPNAYTKLRCRVTDTNLSPSISGCSSDTFAVRPAAFLLSQNTPNLNAGATFTLQASAVQSNLTNLTTAYTATPSLNLAQLGGAATFTSSALFPQSLPAAVAGVSSSTFTYDDVGSFTLPATLPGTYGVSDSTFTAVDTASGANDCVAGSASNTPDGSGKYGCLIGQSAALTVGRFYPDHFDFTPVFAAGCAAGGFTYMEQPMSLGYTVTAKSLARGSPNPPGNTALKLYTGGNLHIAALNGASNLTSRLLPAIANPLTPTWVNGVATAAASNYTFAKPTTTVADATWGPFDALNLGVAIDDADGRGYPSSVTKFVATTPATCTLSSSSECKNYASLPAGTTRMRYGRIQLQNAYGSEFLPLPLPMAIQYWNGNWVSNSLDTCTSVNANQFAWDFLPAGTTGRPNNLVACKSALSVGGAAPNYAVNLSAPGAGGSGWSGIRLNLGAPPATGNRCIATTESGVAASTANIPWLQFNWTGTGVTDPSGRATFGVYRSPLIYRRENY